MLVQASHYLITCMTCRPGIIKPSHVYSVAPMTGVRLKSDFPKTLRDLFIRRHPIAIHKEIARHGQGTNQIH